jgi:hypothetical protein
MRRESDATVTNFFGPLLNNACGGSRIRALEGVAGGNTIRADWPSRYQQQRASKGGHIGACHGRF